MKKKQILTLCFGFLACLYFAIVAVVAHDNSFETTGILGGVYALAVLIVSIVLARFCYTERFSLSWHDYSVITVVMLVLSSLSLNLSVTAEYETLYEFLDVLVNAIPTLSLGVCFGSCWLVGTSRRRRSGGENKR